MLRLFYSRHPLFPVRWANAVTSWLLGLRSNSGSLTINNTATPGNGDGPSIDVNLAWAKALIASETPRPETERVTEDLVPPEEWEDGFGTGYGDPQSQERTGEDSDGKAISVKEIYYPCCGQSILPAAADHRHKSNIAPTDTLLTDGSYCANGAVGTSTYAARFDHKHPYPTADEVVADDGEETKTVQETLEDHNTRIEALEGAEAACDCATKWEEQYEYDAAQDDDITTAYETAEAAQTDATDAKTKVDAITVGDGADAKVPLTALTGNIDGHANTCYVTIDGGGNLGHSGNTAFNLLNTVAVNAPASGATKLLTDADLSSDDITTLTDLAEAATDGVSQTITLCTGISWEYVASAGAKALVFTTQQLTFTNGLLTEVGTAKKTYNEYDGG